MFTIRRCHTLLRHWTLVVGVAILLWSGTEDSALFGVIALGVLLAASLSFWLILPRFGGNALDPRSTIKIITGAGFATGALSSIITSLLMLFKNVRHDHAFPDFPPQAIFSTLERLPAWTIAGALIGFGLSLLASVLAVHWQEHQ